MPGRSWTTRWPVMSRARATGAVAGARRRRRDGRRTERPPAGCRCLDGVDRPDEGGGVHGGSPGRVGTVPTDAASTRTCASQVLVRAEGRHPAGATSSPARSRRPARLAWAAWPRMLRAIDDSCSALAGARRPRPAPRGPPSSPARTGRRTRRGGRRAGGRRPRPARGPGPAPRSSAAGQRHPLARLLGPRRRQQVVGLAVPPAAVAPPHVAHEELRVVVHRPQVRQLAQPLAGSRRSCSTRSSGTPRFISASVCSSIESSSSAVSVSAWRIRSAPKIGSPWPDSSTSAPHPAIWRSAAAQSLAKRCTFCGLPALGTAQMNRSPGWSTLQLGHPRPGGVVGLAAGVVQLERQRRRG